MMLRRPELPEVAATQYRPPEQLLAALRLEIGLHVGQPERPVTAEVVEVVHQGGLAQRRQLGQGRVLQAAVEAPVERRPRGRELPQRRGGPLLVSVQLVLVPPLMSP